MVQATHKLNALDCAPRRVVIMPELDVVLIGVGLLGDTVIDGWQPMFALHRPHGWLEHLPQVRRAHRPGLPESVARSRGSLPQPPWPTNPCWLFAQRH